MRKVFGLVVAVLVGCAGAAETADPVVDAAVDGGAAEATAVVDAGCGLSFDDAVDAFAPERVCQTTEYDLVTGYCTHWVSCSSLY